MARPVILGLLLIAALCDAGVAVGSVHVEGGAGHSLEVINGRIPVPNETAWDELTRLASPELHKVKISCSTCKVLVTILEGAASNQTTMKEIEGLLDDVCDSRYNSSTIDKDVCRFVAKEAVKLWPKLVHGMQELAWNIPLTFCADVVKSCKEPCCSTETTPEQLRLAFSSNDLSTMRVSWITLVKTPTSTVWWWADGSSGNQSATGFTETYDKGGWVGEIHAALITDLAPNTTYYYRVGDETGGISDVFQFTTLPTVVGTKSRPLRVAALADTGYGPNSDETIAVLTALAANGSIDFVIHYGDIGYADGDEQHWDDWGRKIAPITSRVPYMTAPGNHEFWWNFSAYKHRNLMPAAGHGQPADAMFYHLSIGTVNILMLNSETWIDTPDIDPQQQAWVKGRLADAVANRTQQPFLVAAFHRPLYCTSDPDLQCNTFAKLMRDFLEKDFYDSKTDLVITGHMHHWERTWPVYKGVVAQQNYTNPTAPTYLVNGAGGNREGNDMPHLNKPWSVSGSRDRGFAILDFEADVENPQSTHRISIRFYRSENQEVIDSFVIEKDN
jgi:hypothetical protein